MRQTGSVSSRRLRPVPLKMLIVGVGAVVGLDILWISQRWSILVAMDMNKWIDFLAVAMLVGGAIWVAGRLTRESISQVLRSTGFSNVRPAPLVIGLGACALLFPVYVWVLPARGVGVALPAWHPLFHVARLVIVTCFVEELIFRGFLFRLVRRGRSFALAGTVTAVVAVVAHRQVLLSNWELRGVDVLGTSMLIALYFLWSFALCILYERGGCALWASVLLHLAIDFNLLFSVHHPLGKLHDSLCQGADAARDVVIPLLAIAVSRWVLPERQRKGTRL